MRVLPCSDEASVEASATRILGLMGCGFALLEWLLGTLAPVSPSPVPLLELAKSHHRGMDSLLIVVAMSGLLNLPFQKWVCPYSTPSRGSRKQKHARVSVAIATKLV